MIRQMVQMSTADSSSPVGGRVPLLSDDGDQPPEVQEVTQTICISKHACSFGQFMLIYLKPEEC